MKIILYLLSLAVICGCTTDSPPKEDQKIVIYQIFTRLFGSDRPSPTINGDLSVNGVGKFSDFTTTALDSIRELGITHVWYTGVIEHASIYSTDEVGNHPGVIKGKAGSPYAIKDYYDVNSYLADNVDKRVEEFEALVERSHSAGLKVIIDFVPNHVAREYHSDMAPEGVTNLGARDNTDVAFDADNNFYYIPGESLRPKFSTSIDCPPYHEYPAKVTGNDRFSAEPTIDDWYETIKLNYGVDYLNDKREYFDPIPDTWHKMSDILLYWAAKGVDGFRCDMAEMTPYQFWGWAIERVKTEYPDIIFIAEIYNPDAYATYINDGGFDYLYDKVGLYDTLKRVIRGKAATSAISQSRAEIAHVQQHMLNFLENHDEQRIAWHEFAGSPEAGIPMMAISTLSDNIPMMIYFGQELGEESPDATGFSSADGRTTIFDFWTLPLYQAWRNSGAFDGAGLNDNQRELRAQYKTILKLSQHDIFINGQFIDITALNPDSDNRVYTFARYNGSESGIVIANMSDEEISTSYNLPLELIGMRHQNLIFSSNKESIMAKFHNNMLNVKLAPYEATVINITR